MQYITFDEAVAECLALQGDPTPLQRSLFRQWVGGAIEQLGPDKTDRRGVVIQATEGILPKPAGYIYPIDLELKDSEGKSISYIYQGINKDLVGRTQSGQVVVSEGTSGFGLSSGNGVKEAVLEYYSLPLSDTGQLLINAADMPAIVSYVDWMWERRLKRSAAAVAEARQVWKEDRHIAKSRRKTPSMLEARMMARSINSMILTFRK